MPFYTQDRINQQIRLLTDWLAEASVDKETDLTERREIEAELAILNGSDTEKKQRLMREYDFYELKRKYQRLKNILPHFLEFLDRKKNEQLLYIAKRRPSVWRKIAESVFHLVKRQRKIQLSQTLIQMIEHEMRAVQQFIDPEGINPFALQRSEHALRKSIDQFCNALSDKINENLDITTEKRTVFKARIGELGSALTMLHQQASETERNYGTLTIKYQRLLDTYNTHNSDHEIIADKPWALATDDPEYKKTTLFYLL